VSQIDWHKTTDPASGESCVLVHSGGKVGFEFFGKDVAIGPPWSIPVNIDFAELVAALDVPDVFRDSLNYAGMKLLWLKLNGHPIPFRESKA
jgi:hypothetical protein